MRTDDRETRDIKGSAAGVGLLLPNMSALFAEDYPHSGAAGASQPKQHRLEPAHVGKVTDCPF